MKRLPLVAALFVAFILVGASAGALWSQAQRVYYTGTVSLSVGPSTNSVVTGISNSTGDTRTLQLTQARLLRDEGVESAFERRYGYDPDISVDVVTDSSLVLVSATSNDPAGAADAANAYVDLYLQAQLDTVTETINRATAELTTQRDQLIAQVTGLDQQLLQASDSQQDALQLAQAGARATLQSQLASFNDRLQGLAITLSAPPLPLSVVAPATPPANSSSPSTSRSATYGGLIGLFLALCSLWLLRTVGLSRLEAIRLRRRNSKPLHAATRRPSTPQEEAAGQSGRLAVLRTSTWPEQRGQLSWLDELASQGPDVTSVVPVMALGGLQVEDVVHWLNENADPTSGRLTYSEFKQGAGDGPNARADVLVVAGRGEPDASHLQTWDRRILYVFDDAGVIAPKPPVDIPA